MGLVTGIAREGDLLNAYKKELLSALMGGDKEISK